MVCESCKKCKGLGLVEKEKTLKIKIPKGVDEGSKIRIANEGDMGVNGGRPGDLYIVIYVKPLKDFKRYNDDIFTEMEISMPQAVLGDEVKIKTVYGDKIVNIPKTEEQKKSIIDKIGKSFMFNSLEDKDLNTVLLAFEEKKYKAGVNVITQGEDGDVIYLVDQGELDCEKVFKKGDPPTHLKGNHFFIYKNKNSISSR